jgi:transcriptional regulator with XRE-family HTH domain
MVIISPPGVIHMATLTGRAYRVKHVTVFVTQQARTVSNGGDMPDSALMNELGRDLRRGRITAGFTQSGLATAIRIDRSEVSRAENGKRILTDANLKAWCDACGLDHARMAGIARGARGSFPDWFEGWRDDVEAVSTRLGYWDPLIMPAVARTENYVEAVLGAGGIAPAAHQVAAQLARSSVLDRAEIVTVVHEMALRRFVGSPEIMACQLRHLAQVAESPSAHVHVVPNTQTVPGMSGAFSLAHDLGVVHMDGMRGRTTSDPDVFRDATVLFERIRAHALPRGGSRSLILEVADQWKT